MKRTLILFTLGFPFGNFEPFIENEYHIYKNYFDKVLIVAASKKGEKPTRQIEDDVIEVVSDYTLSKRAGDILQALPLALTDKMVYKELLWLIKNKKLTLDSLYRLFVVSMCGNHRAMIARKWLKKHTECSVELVYSYWLSIPAYAAVRFSQKLGINKTVSRAHGFDVYHERNTGNYVPFQGQICDALTNIATISENGRCYLEERYPVKDKISVFRLGAVDKGKLNPIADTKVLRLVSCARVVDVKRLDRIVDALALIKDFDVSWTHIGGGEDFEKLKEHARKLEMNGNIKVRFTDTVPNTEIYEEYANNPYHFFVNVSKSEGLPVSIMEAMSFSIPAIATDVGGTSEIVEHDVNGYLIKSDFTDEELADRFRSILNLSQKEYNDMRKNARKKFEDEFNAISNNYRFLDTYVKPSKKP